MSAKNDERNGEGLGLALVHNAIVRQHGGAIDRNAKVGEGKTKSSPPAGPDSIAQGHETVLVVEDEPQLLRLTRTVLERRGYAVLAACDGQAGVDCFVENAAKIDLVILDRTLPKLRGDLVLAKLRSLRPELKIIVSSGDGALEGDDLPGVAAILAKPYNLTRLCEVVRQILDADDANAPPSTFDPR